MRHVDGINCSIAAVDMATLLLLFVVLQSTIYDSENGDIANTAKEDRTDNYG